MSTWPWIALYTITFVTGTERCELKMLDVRRGNIAAVSMSQDGNVLLADAGQGGFPVAVVFQGDRQSTWEIRGFNSPRLMGIAGDGTILGHYLHNIPRVGTSGRAFLFREGQVRLMTIPQERESENVGFEPVRIGSDGEVFGSYTGLLRGIETRIANPNAPIHTGSAAVLWKGDFRLLYSDLSISWNLGAVARTKAGILGHVPLWLDPSRTVKAVELGHLPVLFADENSNHEPFFLPLPKNIVRATPVFANSTGSMMLALGSGTGGQFTSVMWWHDQPLIPKMPKGAATPTFISGTEDAQFAVGSMIVKQTRVAAIWEADKGARSLEEYAREKGIMLPHGWRLVDAVGITPDGKRVFGNAINRNGLMRPYLLWLEKRPRKVSG